MLSNSCHDSCSTSIMIYNYTTCTAMIPVWKHIFSSQNRWKESEQSMKNIWTYNTLKTNHSGWVQWKKEMGGWCIKICVLQTIFYNVAWYDVTLTKHICHNAVAMLYSHNSLRHDRNFATSKYLIILVPVPCMWPLSQSVKQGNGWLVTVPCLY